MKSNLASAGIAWRLNNGELEVLVLDSYTTIESWEKRSHPRTKFPGGGNREYANETARHTLNREYVHETGLTFPENAILIWRNRKPSTYPKGETHIQYFYAAPEKEVTGPMRTDVIQDGNEWLSPPYWMSASVLSKSKQLLYWHRRPLIELMKLIDRGLLL